MKVIFPSLDLSVSRIAKVGTVWKFKTHFLCRDYMSFIILVGQDAYTRHVSHFSVGVQDDSKNVMYNFLLNKYFNTHTLL